MIHRHHINPWAPVLVALLMLFGIPACSDGEGGGDGDSGVPYDAGQDTGGPGGDDGWTPSDPGYDAGHDAGGSDPGSDPGHDAGYDAGSDQGSGADICDTVEMNAEPIKPNVLLLVDKSGSMNDPTQINGMRTKIQDARDALNSILTFGDGKIRFGWMQFPEVNPSNGEFRCNPACMSPLSQCHFQECTGDVNLIRTLVLQIQPQGGTPTGESLQNAHQYQELHSEERENFIILLTDGVPTCPNGNGVIPDNDTDPQNQDNEISLAALTTLHNSSIDTFVIGLGEDLNNTNPALLNQFAVAGGRPRPPPAPTQYYAANNLDELEQAFMEIIYSVMSCELQLDMPPDIPDWLWVYFDGQPVTRDENHINGWDYDQVNNKVVFYGPACDLLRSGGVTLVEVEVGCGPPI